MGSYICILYIYKYTKYTVILSLPTMFFWDLEGGFLVRWISEPPWPRSWTRRRPCAFVWDHQRSPALRSSIPCSYPPPRSFQVDWDLRPGSRFRRSAMPRTAEDGTVAGPMRWVKMQTAGVGRWEDGWVEVFGSISSIFGTMIHNDAYIYIYDSYIYIFIVIYIYSSIYI